jgi:hypothetical protein
MIARLQTLAILVVLLAVVGIPISVGYATWKDHQSIRREWMVAGTPCPVKASLSAAARGAKPPPAFVYRGAAFAYQIGDVECVASPEKSLFDPSHYTVCQFDAPGAVEVSSTGRTTLFEPGIGHGAAVTVRKGQVSCVVMGPGRFHGPDVGRLLQAAKADSGQPRP